MGKLYGSTRKIWEEEIKVIERRRQRLQEERPKDQKGACPPVQTSLVGLSLSGGGIRSALLNLGVLQELSRLGLLRMVDILSTVSGGGYIGGCLTALLSLKDPGKGCLSGRDVFDFSQEDRGLFGTDWERFPLRDKMEAVTEGKGPSPCCIEGSERRKAPWSSRFSPRAEMKHLRNHSNFLLPGGAHAFEALRTAGALSLHFLAPFLWFTSFLTLITLIYMLFITWLLSTADISINLLPYSWKTVIGFYQACAKDYVATFDHVKFVFFLDGILVVCLGLSLLKMGKRDIEEVHFLPSSFWTVFLAAAAVSILLTIFSALEIHTTTSRYPYFLMDFPLFSICAFIIVFLFYCLMTTSQKFWNLNLRSNTYIMAGSLLSLAVAGLLTALLPILIKMTPGKILPGIQAILAAGIKYLLDSLASDSKKSRIISEELAIKTKKLLFSAAVYLFILFFILIIGQLADRIIWEGKWLENIALEPGLFSAPVLTLGIAAAVFFGLPCFNFNRLSNHYLYRDRLAEAFFQTSVLTGLNPKSRSAEELFNCIVRKTTSIRLSELHGRLGKCSKKQLRGPQNVAAMGPYHIINATLNLTSEHNLKGLKRKTEPFLFSRLFTGSESTGYVETERFYAETTLARAITISGAAVAPIMGKMTSRLTSFACTILGMRLGCWVMNPAYLADGRKKTDRIRYWMKPLFKELTGSGNASDSILYISDGGHCGDNLGIIPLLKRRAKLIISADAECDPDFTFGSLNSSLRQIYVDEGIKIDLRDTWQQFVLDEKGFTKCHHLVGRILYPDRPWQASWLVVLKSSLTGDEMTPIINYKRRSPAFPHETTANQFFTEEQFESYRALGRHIAYEALKKPARSIGEKKAACNWLHLDEFCRLLMGSQAGPYDFQHHWDDVIAAMWDTEQVDFSSWRKFYEAVSRFNDAAKEHPAEDILSYNLRQLHEWLDKNKEHLDDEPLSRYQVPKNLTQFCRLQERLSRIFPNLFYQVNCSAFG